ncbi:uncharacterized protein B0H18DRAFT_955869 [Fomitopsis serialis]|uniref:uncharacterized protein n=1 Tax=Fomitopsis serialis TaxID=139415 RepID=UPI002007AD92|nr:uncharacterized protein B0H18DRAFT_955869 [Neoantrodia serialis]KAH9923568.1 hypothetical protein B0H18DRAFT_955869 [Neoantrodia serialis]
MPHAYADGASECESASEPNRRHPREEPHAGLTRSSAPQPTSDSTFVPASKKENCLLVAENRSPGALRRRDSPGTMLPGHAAITFGDYDRFVKQSTGGSPRTAKVFALPGMARRTGVRGDHNHHARRRDTTPGYHRASLDEGASGVARRNESLTPIKIRALSYRHRHTLSRRGE